jgi:hypothetical protein
LGFQKKIVFTQIGECPGGVASSFSARAAVRASIFAKRSQWLPSTSSRTPSSCLPYCGAVLPRPWRCPAHKLRTQGVCEGFLAPRGSKEEYGRFKLAPLARLHGAWLRKYSGQGGLAGAGFYIYMCLHIHVHSHGGSRCLTIHIYTHTQVEFGAERPPLTGAFSEGRPLYERLIGPNQWYVACAASLHVGSLQPSTYLWPIPAPSTRLSGRETADVPGLFHHYVRRPVVSLSLRPSHLSEPSFI